MKKTITGKLLAAAAYVLLSMAILIGTPSVSLAYTQTTGIVSADAAKVRKEPTTTSDVVVGLLKGSTVTVTDEVTDSAGTLWYKVTADNSTGYIRSDLLIKATTSTGTNTTATDNTTTNNTTANNTQTESKPAATTATPIAETKAYVNYESARIREGASTEHETLGSATKNTVVTITGEAKASDGKKWYQIKYTTSGGKEVVGFIRADLVTAGDPPAATPTESNQPAATEESAEGEGADGEEGTDAASMEESGDAATEETQEPVPEEEELKPDYEMVYTQNDTGENEWYLYDNINGTRQTLSGLMAAAEAGAVQSESDSDQLATQKIIIIVLAVVAALLAVTVTLLLFKIKDLYDDDDYDGDEDDDEEDDEEDDDEEDDDEDEEDDEDEDEPPVRRRSGAKQAKQPLKAVRERAVKEPASKVRKIDYDPEEEVPAPSPVPKKKAKNFLIDDDEFEFEFLNMEDKD
ncbi:uncharacterized protein YgiM (DUF1202 family) [Kineothrix alysoides]|uniref:Uncharacterized protein YgiM (DUF1202 family) n=1 Tax=Kineothrix alysoides TaxID=1469948 RepID=A0A4R1R140_9FIRM|nr:SH3 domain-containing protein [Kineothrix alysoides]TCL58998.1 uncharacterized protein YgiM (DUF1202 family) [Kineothrix alysoides]